MTWRALLVAGVLAALPAPSAGHGTTAEALLAELNGKRSREAHGVERAERDPQNPRLLVIRVGRGFHALRPAGRRLLAAEWRERWRRSVRHGVVSILDARTDAPAVRFGPGGVVAGLAEPAADTPPLSRALHGRREFAP